MKIQIITDAWEPQVNGVVTTLKNTIKCLEARGHIVDVVEPSMFRSFPLPGYKEIRLAFATPKLVAQKIDAFNPDRIHIATEGPIGIAARYILKARGEQWSSSFHTKYAEYVQARFGRGSKMVWKWLARVYRNDAMILATTETMRQELEDHGFPATKTTVWSRGVDEKTFYPAEHAPIPIWPMWLNVGRVSVEKNLEAFYELKLPGVKVQVGDGPALETYKVKYPDVKFVGAKFGKDLADYYRNASVMVFPSKSDTFGLVMIEAMRCGTPVAAFPVTGPLDVIEPGKTGYMNDDLAMAINQAMFIDRADVVRYSDSYTWDAATDRFEAALVSRRPK